jgi:hypothetical protein
MLTFRVLPLLGLGLSRPAITPLQRCLLLAVAVAVVLVAGGLLVLQGLVVGLAAALELHFLRFPLACFLQLFQSLSEREVWGALLFLPTIQMEMLEVAGAKLRLAMLLWLTVVAVAAGEAKALLARRGPEG